MTVLSSLVIAFTDVEVDEDLLGPALILWKLMHADSRLHAPTAAAFMLYMLVEASDNPAVAVGGELFQISASE